MPKNAGEVLIYILGITIVIVLLKGKEAHYSLKKRIRENHPALYSKMYYPGGSASIAYYYYLYKRNYYVSNDKELDDTRRKLKKYVLIFYILLILLGVLAVIADKM
ncbi:MAG TPA: hypothetical protein PKH33_18150 [bacterium]|nr:hypothetical protein [bacterium]